MFVPSLYSSSLGACLILFIAPLLLAPALPGAAVPSSLLALGAGLWRASVSVLPSPVNKDHIYII